MSLQDVKGIKLSYQTLTDEVISNFYIPCLRESINYKRAVGFFSSSILLQISEGLGIFTKNRGKIKLIISPRLSKEDYDAIKDGYTAREYLTNKFTNEFDENINFFQKEERFSLLSYLIAHRILDIKIVVLEKNNDIGMFHEKLGIMEDLEGNKVAFSGSNNETWNGYNINYENIDVHCSWKGGIIQNDVKKKMQDLKICGMVWKED
ncbi:hypothetical protein BN3662_01104 [Clostridiales bacterium CHKCI006]|nr:hypothetical protein BN3662_01104 [Clostridiales bacterium CHKCI006]